MDILEFEIRYRSYEWLSQKFNLGWTSEEISQLCVISDQWVLHKKLNEIDPEELKVLTLETYSEYKKWIIAEGEKKILASGNNLTEEVFTLADYIHRNEYELKVIKEMGFNSYLLVVADFINRAKHHGIPVGPGRWSAAGSLTAWLIGITDVNPMPFELLFERFLNPARVNMPDIDTDFDDEQRELVYEYVREHYGHEKVAKIGTFMNMSAKAAFKDVARAFGLPFDISNRISSQFTILNDDRTVNFQRCWAEIDELRTTLDGDDHIKQIVDITENLIGTFRQTGVHACGVIIWPQDLTQYLPQQLPPNTVYSPKEWNITQYDYNNSKIEDNIGVIKMDFLGLANLSIIKNTIKIIEKRHEVSGEKLPAIFQKYLETSSFEPPLDDILVYETIFQKGNTSGIFQFESEGMRRFLILLKPDRFDDIVSMSALYRPWPIEFIPSFIHRKQWEESIDYMYPELYQVIRQQYGEEVAEDEKRKLEEDLKPILGNTYGVAVFQEQLMFMSQRVAGFSFAQADELRRGIGKKLVDLVRKMKQEFIDKAQTYRDYKQETAKWVFEKMIEPAALYSFNKSHSVAYSMVAMQTAYLKTYYPIEFHAALLRANETNTDELSKFINEIKFQGLKIAGPDVNESYSHVAAINDTIRLWFLCIKGVGSEVSETLQKERQANGNYKDLADFLKRCQSVINKKSLEGLIKSGALDNFMDRGALLENLEYLLERTKSSNQISDGGLFGGGFGEQTLDLKVKHPLDAMSKIKLEYDVFKTFVSFHPLDGLYPWVKARGYSMISQFKNWNYDKEQKDFGAFTIVGLVVKVTRARKKWFFIKIEDFSENIEFFVKDPLNISEFDLLIISWYRGKGSPRRKKIIKVDRDKLVQIASGTGKYDPEETMFLVKRRRLGLTSLQDTAIPLTGEETEELWLEVNDSNSPTEQDLQLMEELNGTDITLDSQDPLEEASVESIGNNSQNDISDDFSDSFEDPSHQEHSTQNNEEDTNIIHEKQWEELKQSPSIPSYELPNDIQIIKKLQQLIISSPGENKLSIWGMNIQLSDEGLKQLIVLLNT
jgi:DNA polymerase-3 subunit alpha